MHADRSLNTPLHVCHFLQIYFFSAVLGLSFLVSHLGLPGVHKTRMPICTQRFPPFLASYVLMLDVCPACTYTSIQPVLRFCIQICLLAGLLVHAYNINDIDI